MHELSLTKKVRIKQLRMLGDLELAVNQVQNMAISKHVYLHSYRHRVLDIIERFETFNIQVISRKLKIVVDSLAIVSSHFCHVPNLLERKNIVCVFVRPIIFIQHFDEFTNQLQPKNS